jgi:hypothetical protein
MKPIAQYLNFPDEASARAASEALMRSKQTEKTRNDPATVTRYYFSWRVNDETKRASWMVFSKDLPNLTEAQKLSLKSRDEAILSKDIDDVVALREAAKLEGQFLPPRGGGKKNK